MMTTMNDLPHDLIGEKILTKVSITSLIAVRCTCKLWNALSKEFIVGRETSRQHREFLGFMMASNKIYPFRFDIQGIRKHNSLVDPSMKQVNLIDQVEISKVFHCDGLLLCFTNDNTKLLVWNPYVGQTRWIRPRKCFKKSDLYAIGYDNKNKPLSWKSTTLVLIWSVLDVISDCIIYEFKHGVSLKGCSYYIGSGRKTSKRWLLCFDYTMERYGQRLPIPYNINKYDVSLSTVIEENLAALYFDLSLLMTLEIWVTNKIEQNAVTWSKFFKVDMMMMNRLRGIMFGLHADICFADEENKVAVVITNSRSRSCNQPKASIIGEDGYFKSIKIGERNLNLPIELYPLLVFSPYIPSLVQISGPFKKRQKKEMPNLP
uniref:F-box domain-containing protein n=1 Tax=Brassica oleracea var. oleracea TaxID=109376 RepID=A0A0D3A472_BRAOL